MNEKPNYEFEKAALKQPSKMTLKIWGELKQARQYIFTQHVYSDGKTLPAAKHLRTLDWLAGEKIEEIENAFADFDWTAEERKLRGE